MSEQRGSVKPFLPTPAHCCQGVCTVCLTVSLMLLTGRCVIPMAQLEFWWLNWRSKAHPVPATNGGFIRELYIYNIHLYREKIQIYSSDSPFCITEIFYLVVFDLPIFNSLIWGFFAASSGACFEFTRPTFCKR